jgi:hypothetical protein
VTQVLPGTKTCAACGLEKPLTDFRTRPNGKGRTYPKTACRPCENAAERANTERRAQAAARAKASRAISVEISQLLRACAPRTKRPGPLPTQEELHAWYEAGCPL